jgi:GNAT superfamily N-acetyltransferase
VTSDGDLMRFHIEALYTHDSAGRIVRVNVPNGAPAPRFFMGRTADGIACRFRHDVDDGVRRELEAAVEDDAWQKLALDIPANPSRYAAILARVAPIAHTEVGPAFCFPAELPQQASGVVRVTDDNAHVLQPHLADWTPDVRLGQPLFALVIDGHAVAVCCSVRHTDDANEAGVETVPAYRGRGYAAQVVAAWARAVRDLGRVPLYSTSWQNTASRGVARKLALIQFGNDLHIT